jgi:ribosomal-protein-alanine N-acetyltransferase
MNTAARQLAVDLRPMRTEDIDAIMAIEERVYPAPWTAGIFADCLRVGYACWVFESDGAVVGYGVMSVGAGEAHVLNLAAHPDFQGRGLGRRMLRHLLRLARHREAAKAFLEVRPSNGRAIALYESLGFQEIGRRKGYYRDPDGREDALVLALPLA